MPSYIRAEKLPSRAFLPRTKGVLAKKQLLGLATKECCQRLGELFID